MGDNISTDEILAGGSRVLPYRSNLQQIATFSFEIVDESYYDRAMEIKDQGGHAVVGGFNYGQGSSREHAALAPRFLGLQVALVKDFARIHLQNLINFGILPITFKNEEDYEKLEEGDILQFENVRETIRKQKDFDVKVKGKDLTIPVSHALTERHMDILLEGGVINWVKKRQSKMA